MKLQYPCILNVTTALGANMSGAKGSDVNIGGSAMSGVSTADIGRIATMITGVLMAISVSPPTCSGW